MLSFLDRTEGEEGRQGEGREGRAGEGEIETPRPAVDSEGGPEPPSLRPALERKRGPGAGETEIEAADIPPGGKEAERPGADLVLHPRKGEIEEERALQGGAVEPLLLPGVERVLKVAGLLPPVEDAQPLLPEEQAGADLDQGGGEGPGLLGRGDLVTVEEAHRHEPECGRGGEDDGGFSGG